MLLNMKKTKILREQIQRTNMPRVEKIPTKVTIRPIRSTSARHLSQRIKRKWQERNLKQTGLCMI
jgi:hypothetical protein